MWGHGILEPTQESIREDEEELTPRTRFHRNKDAAQLAERKLRTNVAQTVEMESEVYRMQQERLHMEYRSSVARYETQCSLAHLATLSVAANTRTQTAIEKEKRLLGTHNALMSEQYAVALREAELEAEMAREQDEGWRELATLEHASVGEEHLLQEKRAEFREHAERGSVMEEKVQKLRDILAERKDDGIQLEAELINLKAKLRQMHAEEDFKVQRTVEEELAKRQAVLQREVRKIRNQLPRWTLRELHATMKTLLLEDSPLLKDFMKVLVDGLDPKGVVEVSGVPERRRSQRLRELARPAHLDADVGTAAAPPRPAVIAGSWK